MTQNTTGSANVEIANGTAAWPQPVNAALREELASNVALEMLMPDEVARSVIESIGRGAIASPELLAVHDAHSPIGKALRLSRLAAAVSLGDPQLVFKAVRKAPAIGDTIEQRISAVRAVYHCAKPRTASRFRRWLSSQSAHQVLEDLLRETDLIKAIRRGTPTEVRQILEGGVDPNLCLPCPDTWENDISPLALAILGGSLEKTIALLEFGANATGVRRPKPHSHTSSFTALHFVAEATRQPNLNRNGRLWREIVSLLIRKGVDINAFDEIGHTALHYIAFFDAFNDRLRFLVGAGANPNAKAPNSWFAIDAAAWNKAGKNFTYLLGLQWNRSQHAHKSAAMLVSAGKSWGWERAIPRLLAAGVEVDAVNEDNKTCLDLTIFQAEEHLQSPLQHPWENKPTIDAWIAFGAKVRPAHLLKYPERSDARVSIARAIRMRQVIFVLEMDEPMTTLRYLQQDLPDSTKRKQRLRDIKFAAAHEALDAGRMCQYWLAGYAARNALNKRKNHRPSLFLVRVEQPPPRSLSEGGNGQSSEVPVAMRALPISKVATAVNQDYDLSAEIATLLQGCDDSPTSEDLEQGLLGAVRFGSEDEVFELLKRGANPNRQADIAEVWSVLGIALMRGQSATVTALLEYGANVHDVLYEPHAAEPNGANAFHALCGCVDAGRGRTYFSAVEFAAWRVMAELLILHGADINAQGLRQWSGDTPLIAAISNSLSLDKCQFLVESGADVNAHSALNEDRNAINAAISHKDIDVLEFLINAGVPVDGVAKHACSPVHGIARDSSSNQIWRTMLPALVDHGADINALDIWHEHALNSVAILAQRAIRQSKAQAAGLPKWEKQQQISAATSQACECIHGWIAAGATLPLSLLRTYQGATAIGKTLRSSPLYSALQCDPPWFFGLTPIPRTLRDCVFSYSG